MSAEAMGWTYRFSPYVGAVFAIHLAIADAVSDVNDNEVWAKQATMASKARVSRKSANEALATLVTDGFLTLIEDNSRAGRIANRYRFEMPPTPVAFEARSRVTPGYTSPAPTADVSPPVTPRVTSGDTEPKREPKTVKTSPPPPTARPRDEVWDAVCLVTGTDAATLTTGGKANVGKVVKELKGVGATAEEIKVRARRWYARFPGAQLTVNALEKHWASLVDTGPARDRVAALPAHLDMGGRQTVPECLR